MLGLGVGLPRSPKSPGAGNGNGNGNGMGKFDFELPAFGTEKSFGDSLVSFEDYGKEEKGGR